VNDGLLPVIGIGTISVDIDIVEASIVHECLHNRAKKHLNNLHWEVWECDYSGNLGLMRTSDTCLRINRVVVTKSSEFFSGNQGLMLPENSARRKIIEPIVNVPEHSGSSLPGTEF
jgi:hypothetical protein